MTRREWSVVLAAFGFLACCPGQAAAAPIATLPELTPVASQGDWLAWSTPSAEGFRLVASHAGAPPAVLPIAPSPRPFALDLGTDRRGRTVAAFARCAASPTSDTGRLVPRQPKGCSIRLVDLASGRERSAGIRRPAGASDTVAAIWRGRIAYARTARRSGDVQRVRFWDPRQRKTFALPHGTMPTNCPYRGAPEACDGIPRIGTVDGIDLEGDLLAFRWQMDAPAVVGYGGYEVRAVRLRTRRTALVGSGYIGEACTGGVDGTAPSFPSVFRGAVWYSQTSASCETVTSTVSRFTAPPRRGARGPLPGVVHQVLQTRAGLLGVVSPPGAAASGPACTAAAPCTIERLAARLTRVAANRLPAPPVFR